MDAKAGTAKSLDGGHRAQAVLEAEAQVQLGPARRARPAGGRSSGPDHSTASFTLWGQGEYVPRPWVLPRSGSVAEEPMLFSELLAGYGTTTIGDGMAIESVFALLKVRAEDGSAAWSVRSGGVALTMEELLGVLDGLTTSIRQRLTRAWKGTLRSEPTAGGAGGAQGRPAPVPFSELLAGLETVGVGDGYLIESVFAVIKARRADGVPVWHVRSAEMKLSSEELLGALEGYATTVRQDLAASWKW